MAAVEGKQRARRSCADAPLGLVAAFRGTSALFGAAGGWLILKERGAKRRLRGASPITVGLVVLVLFG
ncbi:MAG: hypothetical protein WAM81_10245 [Acidimicrobiia bacterium]